MIMIDSKQQLTVDLVAKLADKRIIVADAAKVLNKSQRTIERYLSQYKKIGVQFIVHGNSGKEPINKTPNTIKKQVQKLIKEKYYDLNLLRLSEPLGSIENIHVKRETLRNWAHEIHHVKSSKRRRSKVRKRRERMTSPGLMLQMDGSTHQWFGNKKSCLITIIDDATSELYAEFFPSETTAGCLKVIKKIVEKRGLFKTLYVDRAGIFGGPKRCNFSQVQRACEELGIEIIFANSPQGKGRIERAFDTLQDRLVPEFRLNNIDNINDANNYLSKCFMPNFWDKQIIVMPSNNESEFVQLARDTNLGDICIVKEYRKIRNDHTFSYGNKFYFIDSPLKFSIAKQKIEVRKSDGSSIEAYFAGRKLLTSEVVEPTKKSVIDIDIQKKLDVLALADNLGNVAEASRLTGVSRDTIYRHRKLVKQGGISALKRQETPNHHHKNRTPKNIEELVINYSLNNPHLGQAQVALNLNKDHSTQISSGGVRSIWLRENMHTVALRIDKANLVA